MTTSLAEHTESSSAAGWPCGKESTWRTQSTCENRPNLLYVWLGKNAAAAANECIHISVSTSVCWQYDSHKVGYNGF